MTLTDVKLYYNWYRRYGFNIVFPHIKNRFLSSMTTDKCVRPTRKEIEDIFKKNNIDTIKPIGFYADPQTFDTVYYFSIDNVKYGCPSNWLTNDVWHKFCDATTLRYVKEK